MHHIIDCHIISILYDYNCIQHCTLTTTHRARIHPRNARNSINWNAHLYQDIRKLQNYNLQFDSEGVCHRHSNDMCGSSEREVGQVSEAFAVL